MNPKHSRIIFMGTPDFAVPSLQALVDSVHFGVAMVVTQPDKPAGRNGEIKPSSIKQLALEHGLPILQPDKVKNNPELIQAIKSIQPDTIVVIAYGKILPQELLDIPQYGVVNVHASLLPKYRGASPITASILNNDPTTGVTLMKMELEVDSGPIIAQSQPINIEADDTTQSLSQKLARTGADLLVDALPRYLENEIKPEPQDDTQASHVKLIEKEAGKIDWSEDEELIARKVRAYYPWPSAYTMVSLPRPARDQGIGTAPSASYGSGLHRDLRTKILGAEFVEGTQNPKGQVANIDGQLFIGRLKIHRLQLSGKQPTSGSEFLQGYPGAVGISLISDS